MDLSAFLRDIRGHSISYEYFNRAKKIIHSAYSTTTRSGRVVLLEIRV